MKAKKHFKKIRLYQMKRSLSMVLAMIMAFSFQTTVSAATPNSKKEEVVYGILNVDGTVNGVYVVNMFDQSGSIVDYGDYSTIRNMTTEDKITANANKITANNTGKKLYYEGTLKDLNLPWNISIQYELDGKEYSADEIAGKSGALKIKMKITRNNTFDEFFYKNYALQTTFTLDSKKCTNIVASNATIANVGSDKQLSYIILPDKGADITITADVTDFEMDAVTINGVRLNLDVEVDDSNLMDKVNELTDAVDKLDNGANKLQDGTSDLKNGTDQLVSGAKKLKNGSSDLDDGVNSLKDGIRQIQVGLDKLNSKSDTLTSGSAKIKAALVELQTALSKVSVTADKIDELVNASSKIKTGINQIYTGINTLNSSVGYSQYKAALKNNGLDIDQLQAGNKEAANSLTTQIAGLTTTYNQIKNIPEYESQATQLKAEIDQFTSLVTLLKGNTAAISGTEIYLNNVSTAISKLYSGAAELNKQYETFDSAIMELSQTLSGILVNVSNLTNAINTLVEKYTILDDGIKDYTNGVAQIVAGYKGVVTGVNDLSNGSKKLSTGNYALYTSTKDLMAGVSKLYNGTIDLTDGTGKFKDRTSNMDSEINDQIDNELTKITGDDSKVVSFVSRENTNIKSVQFVMKTSAIEKKEVSVATEKTSKKLNIWQKFLRLFGLY